MTPAEFKDIRKKLKLTQKQLAELLGKTGRTIISYEKGGLKIPVLVEKFMLNLDYFNIGETVWLYPKLTS